MPLLSLESFADASARTRVVLARNPALIDGPCGKIDGARTAALLDEAVRRLTGDQDAPTAWQRLFRPTDVVGIKVNCLSGPRMSTRSEVVGAIVNGLRQAGVAESRIVVWDKDDADLKRAGYTVARGRGLSLYGTIGGQFSPGYEEELRFAGDHVGSCFSRILTQQVTALVNVPVLKDHNIAGVTLGLKNWFGAIHNPNKYHDNLCDPYVAELSTHPSIRSKLRLVVVDATTLEYDGGPSADPDRALAFGGLLVGRDPVAVDAYGVGLIEEERKRAGLPSLEAAGRPARHVETAGRLGLGEHDLARLDVVNI
jgi:uncharacterized protein (DUF362 family)